MTIKNSHQRARICIIARDYLSMTPRVVKEADALHDAGFDVRVVFSQGGDEAKRSHDAALLAGREWRRTVVQWAPTGRHAARWAWSAVRQRMARKVPRSLWHFGLIAERGDGRVFPELARAALTENADLYLGHYMPGLAAAAYAATQTGGQIGFDAEDLHTGEGHPADDVARVDFVQRRYLPRASYVSAASGGIGEALQRSYGIQMPVIIHNTFPLEDRRSMDGEARDRRGPMLSLYWYSQTIGLDRGIQDAIRAAGCLRGPVQVHLRGNVSESTRRQLSELALEVGVAERLYFHPQVAPDELLSRAAEHDVGLALEQGHTTNRALCATNKLFLYMLAGIAIAATDVPGQRRVLSDTPTARTLYTPGDYRSLADQLERWRVSARCLEEAKRASLQAAIDQWNWERESERLVNGIRSALAHRANSRVPAPPVTQTAAVLEGGSSR